VAERGQRDHRAHRVRGRPHVANLQHPSPQFALPAGQHHPGFRPGQCPHRRLVDAGWQLDRGHGVGQDGALVRPQAQPERAHAGPHGAGRPLVAALDVPRPFRQVLQQHRAEGVDVRDRRRERERPVRAVRVAPVEDGQRRPARCVLVGRDVPPGVLTDVQQREAGGAAECLLGGGDGDAGRPVLEVGGDAAEAGDGVDDEQCPVPCRYLADGVQIVHGP
jgi:hypothetical protein